MFSSGRRSFQVRRPTVVDIGCSCRGKKLSSFFAFPLLKRKPKPNCTTAKRDHEPLSSYYPSSSTATSPWETSNHPSSHSTATTSLYGEDTSSPYSHATWVRKEKAATPKKTASRGASGGKLWAGESMAVVKESDDPYLDFWDSMLQMILEQEIYAWEDLLGLLHSFLALNAPRHHELILRAFAEICNGVFSSSPPTSGCSSYSAGAAMHSKHGRPRRRRHGAGRRQRAAPLT